MKHYKSVHAIIIYKKKYFIQKRDNKKNIHFPNFWGLFGGKIAQNESKINAINEEIIIGNTIEAFSGVINLFLLI